MEHSGQSLKYVDSGTGRKFVPHVIEPAVGINRLFLMALCDGYWEDTERNRTVLKLHPAAAPYQAAIFPLVKNKAELVSQARNLYETLLE